MTEKLTSSSEDHNKKFPRCPICGEMVGYDETRRMLVCLKVDCTYEVDLKVTGEW